MAVNFPDLRQAVLTYLSTKVKVTVSAPMPSSGQVINPGETFAFNVSARNASAVNGGVALSNARYIVSVRNANVARTTGTAIDGGGLPIAAGSEVGFFLFDPSGVACPSYLKVDATDSISLTGRAGPGAAGSATTITARVRADPDINELFPRNEKFKRGTEPLTIVGT